MGERFKNFLSNLNIKAIIILISVFNIFDAILTIFWIQQGIAEEANPLMEQALSAGILEFLLLKITLVSLGCFLLYRLREKTAAKIAALMSLASYYFIMIYHCLGFYIAVF